MQTNVIDKITLWRRREDMSEAYISGNVAAYAVHALSLAAAPTFAIMAFLTGALDVGSPDLLCSATRFAPPLNGMGVMYLLMAAFHSPPWLKLIFSERNGSHRVRVPVGANTEELVLADVDFEDEAVSLSCRGLLQTDA
jgi:hypothetical protein